MPSVPILSANFPSIWSASQPLRVDAEPLCQSAHLVSTQRLSALRPKGRFGIIVAAGAQPEDAAGIGRAKVQRVLLRQQRLCRSAPPAYSPMPPVAAAA